MLISIWAVLVMIVGLILYLATTAAKPTEIGRIMFFVGLFWTVYRIATKTFTLG